MAVDQLKIKDLGQLEGEILVFGGPHSNLEATVALFEVAQALNIPMKNRICTGDAVAYCGSPRQTIQALVGSCEWLAGNCEKQLVEQADDCGCGFHEGSQCNLLSRGWFAFASEQVTVEDRALMAECPDIIVFEHLGKRHAVVHGGAREVNRFLWPCSANATFEDEFSVIQDLIGAVDTIIAGHCGVPFERRIKAKTWVNSGAIGMPPNSGNPQTRYVRLTELGARIERLEYDFGSAINAMRLAGLVQGYQGTLETGLWPSDDVLPTEMRRI